MEGKYFSFGKKYSLIRCADYFTLRDSFGTRIYLSSRCSTMERNFDNPYIVFVYYERGGEIDISKEEGNPLIARRPVEARQRKLKASICWARDYYGPSSCLHQWSLRRKVVRRFWFFFWNKDRIPLFFLFNWSPWIVIALQLDVGKYRTHENRLNVCWQLRRFAKFAIQQRFFVLSRVLGLLTLLFRVASLVTKWYSIKRGIFMNEFTRYSNFRSISFIFQGNENRIPRNHDNSDHLFPIVQLVSYPIYP